MLTWYLCLFDCELGQWEFMRDGIDGEWVGECWGFSDDEWP